MVDTALKLPSQLSPTSSSYPPAHTPSYSPHPTMSAAVSAMHQQPGAGPTSRLGNNSPVDNKRNIKDNGKDSLLFDSAIAIQKETLCCFSILSFMKALYPIILSRLTFRHSAYRGAIRSSGNNIANYSQQLVQNHHDPHHRPSHPSSIRIMHLVPRFPRRWWKTRR